MKISVVGAGYVGLVSAACFSEFGFEVQCIDKEPQKIAALKEGRMPIYEPGLDLIVHTGQRSKRLNFTTELTSAVSSSDIVFIAVGTPSRRGNDAADLSYVHGAAREIAEALSGFTVVVTKSTVPVGTAEAIQKIIGSVRPDVDFEVASNPEFLREGSAVEDFLRPDRIVVGVESDRARALIEQLYRPLTQRDVKLVFTSPRTAELIKYAANTYLATRIGLINQLADLCEAVGADIQDLTRGMGLDRRIGQHYLQPGPGFGGSCFPKDTRALTAMAREDGVPVTIVEEVIAANEARKERLVARIEAALDGGVKGRRIAVFGIAFKAETDDIRDAAAGSLMPALQEKGAVVAAYDPAAMEQGRHTFEGVQWCADPYSAALHADAVVILTEWNEFRGLNLQKIAARMAQPILIDFRNLFEPDDVALAGLHYLSLGRSMREAILPSPKLKAVAGLR